MTADDTADESKLDGADPGAYPTDDGQAAEVGSVLDASVEDESTEDESDYFDEFDESALDGPANLGAPPVSNARKGAVATAFLGAGLALEQIIYGVERSVPAVVQEASEPDPDADLVVHLDKDDPKKSWARVRDES